MKSKQIIEFIIAIFIVIPLYLLLFLSFILSILILIILSPILLIGFILFDEKKYS